MYTIIFTLLCDQTQLICNHRSICILLLISLNRSGCYKYNDFCNKNPVHVMEKETVHSWKIKQSEKLKRVQKP